MKLKPPRPKQWSDPVKNHPAKESTLNVKGDFKNFTELMRRIVNKKANQ